MDIYTTGCWLNYFTNTGYMKKKLVLWGTNAQEERILIALQLRPKDNKVDIWTFPETVATEDFANQLLQDWRNGAEVAFPEENNQFERELNISESLLPPEIKVARGDIVQRAQTEWHFIVLSAKLNAMYQSELNELKERIDQLETFDNDIWDALKEFWGKVQKQVRERNLFREHANSLRDNTNVLFAKLKELRSTLDQEFKSRSKNQLENFMNALQDIESRIVQGLKLPALFDELKAMQRQFREAKLTREHRSIVWSRLDAAFKAVKEKRYGPSANVDSTPLERLKRRYDGLLNAIQKMEKSIGRDKDDLAFQDRKIATTDGQLEAQIRQAKIKMIQERIRSKEEKLTEMMATKEELEKRMTVEQEKEAKRQEREKIEKAKSEAKAKIAEQIKKKEAERQLEAEKSEQDNEDETDSTKMATPLAEEAVIGAINTKMDETIVDVVDTARVISEVVEKKVEGMVDQMESDAQVQETKPDTDPSEEE